MCCRDNSDDNQHSGDKVDDNNIDNNNDIDHDNDNDINIDHNSYFMYFAEKLRGVISGSGEYGKIDLLKKLNIDRKYFVYCLSLAQLVINIMTLKKLGKWQS